MREKSISAYNSDERVHRYDADMDLMHPNRHKMIDIALEALPQSNNYRIIALDIGIGSGFFTWKLLYKYPKAEVIGIDGSEAMIQLAKKRLEGFSSHVQYLTARFVDIESQVTSDPEFDVVISAYALHHLDSFAKEQILKSAVSRLKVGGWFLNADIVISPFPDIEKHIQRIRVSGIENRNKGLDPRFRDAVQIRSFLDKLEKDEGDQPLTMDQDLNLLKRAGISNATIFWQEYREVVYGGSKGNI